MAVLKEDIKPKFHQVRSIYGHGRDRSEAMERYNYIPEKGMNEVIKAWQDKQPERELVAASPSQITKCARAIWLTLHQVTPTQIPTWAMKQRMLLGRLFENQFAEELAEAGMLLHHWKDDPGVEVNKFHYGEKGSPTYFEGVPDYLVQLPDGRVVVSDAKTSRGDSFGYVPINDMEIFTDGGWYKNKLQLIGYYILCHSPSGKKWFAEHNLPLPTACHLFSYALDDGIVRREVVFVPTQAEIEKYLEYTRRFNAAMTAVTCPECTCDTDLPGGFAIKFCPFGKQEEGQKICSSCCDDSLIPLKEV